MKTAAFILNHNLPEYTDWLYESLKPYERNDYDLFVIDNGSSVEGRSKYTSYASDTNTFFGGGFNAGMQITLADEKYDSMMFLNNDLTVHPYNFIKSLRDEMLARPSMDGPTGYDLISPCFFNVEATKQCHWKMMHCYSQPFAREVPYIDFQCPLISRRLLEEVKEIHPKLLYGWGVDWLFALKCKQRGWRIGVSDRNCVLHHNSLTVKKGVAGIDIPTYCRLAEQGQRDFFVEAGIAVEYTKLRWEAENYKFI